MSEKLTRRDTREAVFLLLFQNELSGNDISEAAEACVEAYDMALEAGFKYVTIYEKREPISIKIQ